MGEREAADDLGSGMKEGRAGVSNFGIIENIPAALYPGGRWHGAVGLEGWR